MTLKDLPRNLKDEIISFLPNIQHLNWYYAIEMDIYCALKCVSRTSVNETVLRQIIKHKKHKVFSEYNKLPRYVTPSGGLMYETDVYSEILFKAVLCHNNKPNVIKLVLPFVRKPISNKILFYAVLNNTFKCYLALLPHYQFDEHEWSVKELNDMLAHTYKLRLQYLEPLVPYMLHRPEDLMALGWSFD